MSGRDRKNRRGTYYDPPAVIRTVPGVTVRQGYECELYTGTAEALVRTGLVPLALLPGQPGMPVSVVSLRPRGRVPDEGSSWWRMADYLVVRRRVDGLFVIQRRTVDRPLRRAAAKPRESELAVEAWAEDALRDPTGVHMAFAQGYTLVLLQRLQQGARHG